MAHKLEVWLFDNHIGTLALVEGRLNFWYTAEWLKQPNAVALSCSLPLQAEPFDDRKARPFIAGLLPEGQMRRLIAQQFQVSSQNDFALLDHIGGECAGAVTFLEPGQSLRLPTEDGEVQWLSDEEVIAILDELPRRPMLAGKDGLRLLIGRRPRQTPGGCEWQSDWLAPQRHAQFAHPETGDSCHRGQRGQRGVLPGAGRGHATQACSIAYSFSSGSPVSAGRTL